MKLAMSRGGRDIEEKPKHFRHPGSRLVPQALQAGDPELGPGVIREVAVECPFGDPADSPHGY